MTSNVLDSLADQDYWQYLQDWVTDGDDSGAFLSSSDSSGAIDGDSPSSAWLGLSPAASSPEHGYTATSPEDISAPLIIEPVKLNGHITPSLNFNAANEEAAEALVDSLLKICMAASIEGDLKACIDVLESIVTYGAIPQQLFAWR